jgi:predicted xylose isomerase-like sugar epimerase
MEGFLTMENNKVTTICTDCGAKSGLMCPMSDDGEGPHNFIEVEPLPTFRATPTGHLPLQTTDEDRG